MLGSRIPATVLSRAEAKSSKARPPSWGGGGPRSKCPPRLLSGGQASFARNCGFSLLDRRRSLAPRRRFLGSIAAGNFLGSRFHTALVSRFRHRPQRLLRSPGLEILPWLGRGKNGLFR